jgi:hypothetical protein
VDLRREQDIEHLRRIAIAQQIQIEQLLRMLRAKCEELEALKGDPAELQQTLALVETLTRQQQKAATAVGQDAAETEGSLANSGKSSVPLSNSSCQSKSECSSSTSPIASARAAAASSTRWTDS